MHPYLIEAAAAAHVADLRHEADADRRAAGVPRPHLLDRWASTVAGLTAVAFRPRTSARVAVCCPA